MNNIFIQLSPVILLHPYLPHLHTSTLSVFLFTATSTSDIYTLSLHDALPIFRLSEHLTHDLNSRRWLFYKFIWPDVYRLMCSWATTETEIEDRKSTRLNSSHVSISYAVFCLKKKK